MPPLTNKLDALLKDNKGRIINPENYAQVLAYTAGKLTTITFTDGTNTYTKTYSYTGDDLTGISAWVRS